MSKQDPSAPYNPPQTAAQQGMQQPQSGSPSTTGGMGMGTRGPLPQAPGSGTDQAGAKSLSSLVDKLKAALSALGLSQAGTNQLKDALDELSTAANQADEEMKQTGSPQYPAPPPKQTKLHPETTSQTEGNPEVQ